MTLDTILMIVFGIIDVLLIGYELYERNRIKAKEEVWNRDIQSIVNIAAKWQERIDSNLIQEAKELRSGIEAIGQHANAIYTSIEEELKKKN
jgi:hypothetical protein